MIGETIRDFEIMSELGAGGYGAVYRAHDVSVDRDVAIKVILPQYADKEDFKQRFESEARLVAKLESPRIVPLYSYWQDEQGAFLVMRLIRGGSLRRIMAKQGAMSLSQAMRILSDIAEALTVAHENDVVHRDLKPENILIDERGNAYLTDFGIAKRTTDAENITEADAIVGTWAYLSPEQVQNSEISPQTDIYAFGILLYEMLAGKHPFHGTPATMMVMKHLQEALPDIHDERLDLPRELDDIIQKATAKEPSERYESTLALIADLKMLAKDSSQSLAPIKTVQRKKPTSPEERNRQAMLDNVRTFWVEGVLENSLHDAAMIDLGLKSESGAVDNPWDTLLRTPNGDETLNDESISNVFERMNGKLLILGEPGSGKTTTLLTLARELLFRAELDDHHPIPVVFNLSSWSENQPPLTEWLVDELNSKYQVPRKVGEKWVADEELLLLLDGLDEVAEDVRDACVLAINVYREEHGFVDVVVCSRTKDYEALTGQLRLKGAIVIQPLDDAQIVDYLDGLGSDVAIVRELITRDAQLRELAQSPLMLSIMILAYRGKTASDIPNFDDVETQRQHLLEVYIERMFDRRLGENVYTKEETIHHLSWLAKKMQEHVQTVFQIEGLQPSWLPKEQQKTWQWYPRLTYVGIFGLLAFLAYFFFAPIIGFPHWGALTYGLAHLVMGIIYTDPHYLQRLVAHSLYGVMYFIAYYISFAKLGAIGLIFAGLLGVAYILISSSGAKGFIERGNNPDVIQPVDRLSFSLRAIHPWYRPILSGLFGPVYIYSFVLFGGADPTAVTILLATTLGLIGNIFAMVFILGMTSSETTHRARPNQGITNSVYNALRWSPIFIFPSVGVFVGLLFVIDFQIALGAYLIFGIPMFWGWSILFNGGYPALQHVLLRQLLQREYDIPRNLASFLNYTRNLILLRKVRGGYIFIHRYLLEYFADLEIEEE